MSDPLTPEEVRQLARSFPPGPSARTMLSNAGFPAENVPAFVGVTAMEFWEAVALDMAAGVMPGGRAAVLRAARARFPANQVFRAGLVTVSSVLVVGAAPQDQARVRADQELRAILAAAELTGLVVHSCPAADVTDLQRVLQVRPDVLHLACHGDADGNLVFEYTTGREHRVPASRVAEMLANYRANADVRLRGLVLGSCFGADIAGQFAGLADTIVAHREEIPDECAVAFAGELYRLQKDDLSLAAAARIAADHVAVARHLCRTLPGSLLVLESAAASNR